jgi:hypothetical protein
MMESVAIADFLIKNSDKLDEIGNNKPNLKSALLEVARELENKFDPFDDFDIDALFDDDFNVNDLFE